MWAVTGTDDPSGTMESFDSDIQLLARRVLSCRCDCATQPSLTWHRIEGAAFCDSPNNSSNVLNRMRISPWNIPEYWKKASSECDTLAKIPTCPVECDQLWIPDPDHRLINYLTPVHCLTIPGPTSGPATPAASAKVVANMLGSPFLSPLNPIQDSKGSTVP